MPLLTVARVRGEFKSEGGLGVLCGGRGPIGGRGGGLGFSSCFIFVAGCQGNVLVLR